MRRDIRVEVVENGYIYLILADGKKRYIIVDVPNTAHYGLLKLGEPESEGE